MCGMLVACESYVQRVLESTVYSWAYILRVRCGSAQAPGEREPGHGTWGQCKISHLHGPK